MTQLPEPFTYRRVDADGVSINVAVGGTGDPVLLLHGYPQTHLMWRDIAPDLARDHTVVVPDLRGYGASDKPTPDHDARNYGKRAMAADQVAVMRSLGFDRFDLVGHDRGARVSHRLTLDHPDAVARLALLDIVPTRHVFANVTRDLAFGYFHWFFLATGGDVPETLLRGAPEFWIRTMVERLLAPGVTMEPEVMDHYIAAFSDPATIAATTADYKAGAGIDLTDDEETWDAGQRLECPTLVLWGEHGFVGKNYDPLAVWGEYAHDVTGRAMPSGHFIPEEAPAETLAELQRWLSR
jgi:haloacetate dehalogenase